MFPVIYPFTCFGCFFLCFLLLFAFSPLLLLCPFLFCLSFAASSCRSLSLPPSPLSSSFLALPSSALFSLLSSSFLFLPLLLFPSFPSSSSSFSFPFWVLLLLSPLAPLSWLSLPFLLLLPSLLFLLRPLSSSLFLFRLRFFPSTLFFPSCSLFFLLVCPRYLWWFPLLPLCLRPSLILSLRFWVVLVLLCVSRVGVFGPGVLFSCLYLCLLSSSLVGSFSCLCF